MKISEIKGLTTDELKERIETEAANYSQMKFNHSISPLQDTSQFSKLRHDIARMKGELRQRELNK
ncbi:MAG: 50S ribosomal protein L29 [Bacteroidaceae bacterium]|jgi:large subunit ribosomal protein L29|nr:50S ribosomal protein L29 [Bacteroidaceae bacterium]